MKLPLSDEVLDNIEHAMGGYLTFEEDELVFKGADFQLSTYLDFLAGAHGYSGQAIGEGIIDHTDTTTFSERDLIRALIEEVRTLREVKNG